MAQTSIKTPSEFLLNDPLDGDFILRYFQIVILISENSALERQKNPIKEIEKSSFSSITFCDKQL